MKRILAALALLVIAIGFTSGQKKPITQVQVTSQMVKRQPGTKAYTLNLTKSGTIYTVANGVDYSKVSVHTEKGDMTVADLIKKSGKNITGKVRVGMTSDIRTQKLGLARRVGGGGRLNFSCGDLACVCSGDDDCNDLFTSTNCGPIAVCYEDGCFCLRL